MEILKEQLKQLIQDIDNEVQNPYEALFQLKDFQKSLKETVDIVEGLAFGMCEYEDKTFVNGDYKIEKRNGRKVWNFKKVEEWINVDLKKKSIEDKLKAAYSANEKGLNMGDENGEVIPLPQVTFTKDTLLIKKA